MKTKLMIICILLVLKSLLNEYACYGQFVTANDVDISATNATTGTINTGCDLIRFSSQDFFVSVWDSDNNTSSILYNDYSGNSGVVPLANADAQDPDVALIYDGTDIFAIVTYYTTSSGSPGAVVAEIYDYFGGSFSLNSGPTTLLNNVNQPTAINVDGNRTGDFVVVFDKDSSGITVPQLVTGYTSSSTPLWYFTPSVSVMGGTAPNGSYRYSDVCIWDSATVGTEIIYISYVDSVNNDILIQEERWQNIDQASPGINYTIFDSFGTANGTINAQRIACANGNGSRYHMTVAFSDGFTIESWTNYTGASPLQQDINDGSAGSLDLINGAPNTRPVVTYDESGNYITIAWNYNNSNSTYGAGYHPAVSIPIAVLMNAGGSIGSTDYLDVPRTIDTQERAISICSRWSGQSLIGVAWFDNSISKEIFYKVVSSPPSDFRTTMNSPIKLMSDELRVYDLQGKLLKVTVEKVHNVPDFLRSLNLQRGVYIIKGLESTTAQNQMYFVQ